MSDQIDNHYEPDVVPHPGETVLEYLDFNDWPQRDLARRTGLTPKTISEICSGKAPITATTALAFEKAFQRPAHLWLSMQRQFDEAQARQSQLAKASGWTEWVKCFPLKEMRRLRFSLPSGRSEADVLLNFFGVSSPESWNAVWNASAVAYRQTRVFNAREQAIAAWVREAEIVARGLEVAPFDDRRFCDSLGNLRALTRKRTDEILDPLQQICAAAGVAFVLVPALPRTGISGCAKWLGEKRALIAVTLRYKTDDQFWFTIFHEIAHILLHRGAHAFILDNAAESLSDQVVDSAMELCETEANKFARDTLIPPQAFEDFVRKGVFTNQTIHDFADGVGVGPGIVVGRLQHDELLARHQGNALKQKLDWGFAQEE